MEICILKAINPQASLIPPVPKTLAAARVFCEPSVQPKRKISKDIDNEVSLKTVQLDNSTVKLIPLYYKMEEKE